MVVADPQGDLRAHRHQRESETDMWMMDGVTGSRLRFPCRMSKRERKKRAKLL